MGRIVGSERLSDRSLRLKRICDCQVNINNEGEVDYTVAQEEAARMSRNISELREARKVGAVQMCDIYYEPNSAIGMR